ncbi:hypothetical protein HY932_01790 [Candidatus Falkowbacteria bacterium]|nr:hypothetical protein [Candidatus Falkowbacteria bacterium]
MFKKILLVFIISGVFFGIFSSAAMAAFPSLVPEICRGDAAFKECGLSQVQLVIVTVAQMILGVSGSIALLMFVIGGIMYLTSGGNPSKVQKGTKMITGAAIGLLVIFSAGVIIKFLLGTLVGTQGLVE